MGSVELNVSIIKGIGIEIGQVSDGEFIAPYITLKNLSGIDASIGVGVTKLTPLDGNTLNIEDIGGNGGEFSLGAFMFSYSFGSDNYLDAGGSLDPTKYTTRGGSIGLGLDIGRTDANTKTFVGPRRRVDDKSMNERTIILRSRGL